MDVEPDPTPTEAAAQQLVETALRLVRGGEEPWPYERAERWLIGRLDAVWRRS